MPITIEIIDDRKAWDELFATTADIDGLNVYAGIFDPELATRGYRHEFGKGVPERPWGGPAGDEATQRAISTAAREIGDALDGDQSAEDALEEVGEVFEDAMVNYVEAGRVGGKPIGEAASARDSRKLINSGDMIDAIETKVAESIPGEDS